MLRLAATVALGDLAAAAIITAVWMATVKIRRRRAARRVVRAFERMAREQAAHNAIERRRRHRDATPPEE